MFRTLLASLVLVATAACGAHAPIALQPYSALPASQAQTRIMADDQHYQGAYLSVDVRPDAMLANTAGELRQQLGFLDMSRAQPARAADEFHITVAYFQTLTGHSANEMAEVWRNKTVAMTLTGWGVAKNQAAYFTVDGIDQARQQLKTMRVEAFTYDDPHVTFGVQPSNPQDVHNVPKPTQHALPALRLVGDVHLKQGTKTIW